MALTNRDGRCLFRPTALMHRVLLFGVIATGLFVTGCGGSGETPETSSDSASETDSAEASMPDPGMMSSPEMTDPTMDPSMDESMAMAMAGGEEFGDTSAGHGEDGLESESGSLDSERAAMMAAGSESDPALSGADPGLETERAEMLASAEAAAGNSTDPNETNAEMAAEMAVAQAGGLSAPGSPEDSEGFGPGDPSDPGRAGGGGGGKAQEPPADSPDYPAFKIVMGLMEGKHDGLKDHVSTRGRGLIEKIRTGSLTKAEKDDLKTTFAQPQLAGTPRTIRGSRSLILNSGGQVITMVSKKQGSAWKVSTISIRAAKKR